MLVESVPPTRASLLIHIQALPAGATLPVRMCIRTPQTWEPPHLGNILEPGGPGHFSEDPAPTRCSVGLPGAPGPLPGHGWGGWAMKSDRGACGGPTFVVGPAPRFLFWLSAAP